MLEHLSVRNFAIIEHIDLDLSNGMTVFSGETGAGKSLIVDALGFLLGARAEASLIREGAQECSVAGIFSVSYMQDSEVQGITQWFQENAIDWEPREPIFVRRVLKSNGRSLQWIQDSQFPGMN